MKVTLIHATPGAVDLLLFTKNTRLNLNPGLLEEIRAWPEDRKLAELEYMSRTIPSSWEFVDLIFSIEGVTRAFTHQFVRTRNASYAQQSMRVTDMTGFDYSTGPTIQGNSEAQAIYDEEMRITNQSYRMLIDAGATPEDARGVLPTNIKTNIVAKYNLRTFSELVISRSDGRVQNEYKQVLQLMVGEVLQVWPWAKMFITPKHNEAFDKLTKYLEEQITHERQTFGVTMNNTYAWSLLKELNLIRKEVNK